MPKAGQLPCAQHGLAITETVTCDSNTDVGSLWTVHLESNRDLSPEPTSPSMMYHLDLSLCREANSHRQFRWVLFLMPTPKLTVTHTYPGLPRARLCANYLHGFGLLNLIPTTSFEVGATMVPISRRRRQSSKR